MNAEELCFARCFLHTFRLWTWGKNGAGTSKLCGVVCALALLALFASSRPSSAQSVQSPRSPQNALVGTNSLNRSAAARYEIHEIAFEGNTAFPSELLATVISSRPSELSLTRRITIYIARELRRNPATPNALQRSLAQIQRQVSNELRYLDRNMAGSDTVALALFYHQNGFHHASVDYDLVRNRQTGINTLVFRIQEGKRSLVDTVVYYGLDGVADDVRTMLQSTQTLSRGMPFRFSELGQQNERMLQILRNHGYYNAQYSKPVVTNIITTPSNGVAAQDSVERDSITVFFRPAQRFRIGSITYIDSSAAYTYLSPTVQQAFVELKTGDWLSDAVITRSINNLHRLGLFDMVVIDTTSRYTPHTDSSLSLRVVTRTRSINELSYGPSVGQDPTTGLFARLEARYTNRNLLGGAEVLDVFLEGLLLNATNLFDRGLVAPQFEGRVGTALSKPVLATFADERRLAFDANVSASIQRLSLAVPLWLRLFTVQASLPLELHRYTVLNRAALNFTVDSQSPLNFSQTKASTLQQATTDLEREFINLQLLQYGILDTLTNSQNRFLTNAVLSVHVRGDHRDNLFAPRTGYVLDASVDWGTPLGISSFLRVQANLAWFTPLAERAVFAAKFRAGHTILLNADVFYVPFERHFFAGGSNSLRGWGSRELRFRRSTEAVTFFVDQIVGNGSIIEGSAELRWTLRDKASEFDSFWDRQLSRLGITGFVDVGNAFNSFQEPQHYGNLAASEVLNNLAIAAGAGLRYDTPAGPLRIDLALRVYDPTERARWLGQRPAAFRVQIGLGHAF